MAVSRGTSNSPDWIDIAVMISEFERQNKVRIELSIAPWTTNGAPDLNICGKAWDREADRRVAKPLAFTSVRCQVEQVRTLEGLVTYLLYRLDFMLAESAWQSAKEREAKPPHT